MNNSDIGKTMENVGKHRDIKLETIKRRRSHLVSEPHYHKRHVFFSKFMSNRKEKNKGKNE